MKIPPGYTEADVLAAIEKAAAILAPSFVFGAHQVDDVKQFCFVYAIELLDKEKFDPARPLENYIYTHLRNRLINLKRNQFRRSDPPCPECHAGLACPGGGDGVCPKQRLWAERNQAKANLSNPLAIERISDEREARARCPSTVESDAEIAELLEKIDLHLPVELRQSYLQMRAGVQVPKARRLQVEEAVRAILGEVIERCPSADD